MAHVARVRLLLPAALALTLTACLDLDPDGNSSPPGEVAPAATLRLQKAQSCDGLRAYLEQAWLTSLLRTPFAVCADCEAFADDGVLAGAPEAGGGNANAPDDVSRTNTQEAGVDEADLVKAGSDGRLYTISANLLLIARGFPPGELAELGRLDLEARPLGLYLDEAAARVIVVAATEVFYALEPGAGDAIAAPDIAPPVDPAVELLFVDVGDPAAPRIERRLRIDGHHVATRRTQGRLHLVSRTGLGVPPQLWSDQRLAPWLDEYWSLGEAPAASPRRAELERLIAELVHEFVLALEPLELLPALRDGDLRSALVQCGDVFHPGVDTLWPELLTVTSLAGDGSDPRSASVVGNGSVVYANAESLYVSQPSSGWWWREAQSEQTAVHRFEIGERVPRYSATGSVPGHVRDSFAFSEHAGYLRVASTQWTGGRTRTSSNHLSVLEDTGRGELRVAGAVNGFAPGETIFSSRFVGERGFVVTFRQIDPLFSFDLSDPRAPVLRGELEIPGFSTYMHPIDDRHLLTIGRAGTAAGASWEVQLQIFDVGDLDQPRRVAAHVPAMDGTGYSWSEAGYDHHAFTYYAPLQLLAIPLSYSRGDTLFNGFIAFRIDPATGIREIGRVSHSDLARAAYCPEGGAQPLSDLCRRDGLALQWLAHPRRSVVMTGDDEAFLYTLSSAGLKASPLTNLGQVLGTVVFPASQYRYYY